MNVYSIQSFFDALGNDMSLFYHSGTFLFIKILIGIYVAIVFIDIVLLIIQRGPGANWRQMRYGVDIPSEFVTKKGQMQKLWDAIRKRLDSGNESEYKVAIIEADNIIDDLIKRMGYKGADMGERLAGIPEGQLAELAEIKEAHDIRNRIIHEEDFQVNKELAKEVLKKYEHLLHHFEVLG
jgi:hypothetical protein